jgi:hypothetical protein
VPRYKEDEAYAFLISRGYWLSDAFTTPGGVGGQGWVAPDGMDFIIPSPQDGWYDAELFATALADNRVYAGPIPLKKHPDP